MWAQKAGLRTLRSRLHRTVRFSRKYNGSQGPHTTYFQPPPEPRPQRSILRSLAKYGLFGTICTLSGMGIAAYLLLDPVEIDGSNSLLGANAEESDILRMEAGIQDMLARKVPSMTLDQAQEVLEVRNSASLGAGTISHFCSLPSNLPCEDSGHSGVYNTLVNSAKNWGVWSIYDGHSGPAASYILDENLVALVGKELTDNKCMDRPYAPNDYQIIRTIKETFLEFDKLLIEETMRIVLSEKNDMSQSISGLSAALSGSCALLALFDPVQSVLRVANVGDSRAVLGRWDSKAGKYVAKAMSFDHTGFNRDELERINLQHPDEESIVDPKTGRVHGLAVSRAFGDAPWKWPNDLTKMVWEKFWGPPPRPNDVIKTPPYLTAEPEITETKIQTAKHPDFLIMASDGLWDQISSENAVICVQQWLDQYQPLDVVEKRDSLTETKLDRRLRLKLEQDSRLSEEDRKADADTYWDENERTMKWHVSPKHFITEDHNCAAHLVKNALGGNRRNLFCGVMSVQPPLSRKVRDDITVHVIFFGVDNEKMNKAWEKAQNPWS